MPTVLLTGFEPFGGEPENPSSEAVSALSGRVIAGRRVVAVTLPCVFGRSIAALTDAVARHDPELVICVGQAGGRAEIAVERVAINVDDARIADNAGAQPVDVPVIPGGPAAYWSTLPIKAIVAALRARHIPAAVSQSAGTFVCNHVFYGLMHRLAEAGGKARGGFIHVPFTPSQAARRPAPTPSLPIDVVIDALAAAVETSSTVHVDAREAGGALHGDDD